jgi:hypothetical protein
MKDRRPIYQHYFWVKTEERDVVFPTGNTETDSMISVTSLNDINNTNLLNALNVRVG